MSNAAGGLAVDTQLRVTDGADAIIYGLWAAGSTGQGGLQLLNHGLHIGWAMVSGRIAGRHASQGQPRADLSPLADFDSVLTQPITGAASR